MHDHIKAAFQQAFKITLEDMFMLNPILGPFVEAESEFNTSGSAGVASLVGFVGKVGGRCLLWFPALLAKSITEELLEEKMPDYRARDVLYNICEINNVVCGQAITILNNQYKLELDLTPPSVFAGTSLLISTPKVEKYQFKADIEDQTVFLNLAVEGGR